MIPLRLVIDTNIVVSAALKPNGLQRTVFLLAITKPARLYVTDAILAEYGEVLARPELKIRRGLRQELLQLIKNHGQPVRAIRPLRIAKDPDDDKFLECADAARADYLGDRQPAAFSEVLEEDQGDYVARVHRHRGTASDHLNETI
jgi:putative PIN family toxin of toxin-antitoxin system